MTTRSGLGFSQRCSAGNAGSLTYRVGSFAVLADHACEALRELLAGSSRAGHLGHYLPDPFCQLEVANVLGDIVEPAQQVPRVHQGGHGCLAKAGSHSEPLLLARLDHHAVLDCLDIDRQGRLSAGTGPLGRGDLHSQILFAAQKLSLEIALVEFSHQCRGNFSRGKGSVKNAFVHSFSIIIVLPFRASL